jgi:hypothetical protein
MKHLLHNKCRCLNTSEKSFGYERRSYLPTDIKNSLITINAETIIVRMLEQYLFQKADSKVININC